MAEFAQTVSDHVDRLRKRKIARDQRMLAWHLVMTGRAEMVFQNLFPSDWPKPVIANTVKSAAEDAAMMIGVLPTLGAAGDSQLDESKRSRTDKNSRIINYLAYASALGNQLPLGALRFVGYGFMPIIVEPNMEENRPEIRIDDPMGAYYERDRFRRVTMYCKVFRRTISELSVMFPEHAAILQKRSAYNVSGSADEYLDVVRYWDKDRIMMYVPKRQGLVLSSVPNLMGEVPVAIAELDSIDNEERGGYDDALWVFAAKARLALLNMEGATKAIEAPIALPNDVQEFNFGPDALLRSNSPEKIRRVALDIPNSAMFEMRNLDEELKLATHFPDVRAGQTDASVVTGRGVQALLGGFDQRIKGAQTQVGSTVADSLTLALKMDKQFFGDQSKKVYASVNGAAYELTYTPNRDIISTHVSAEYGVMAGLDPSRSLVWSLQALGAGLVSESFVRRNLPININASEEEKLIDVEKLRGSLLVAAQSYAQAIPELATQGGDPLQVIQRLTQFIDDRKKGVAIEIAAAHAFKPPEPEPDLAADPALDPAAQAGAPVDPNAQMGGAAGPPAGAQPGGGPSMPAQPPSMQQLLAQLSTSGDPRMSARTVRQTLV